MPLDRIKTATSALPSLNLSEYSIFEGNNARKRVSVWQPSGKVDNITSFPEPRGMRPKACSFLQKTIDGDADLGVAPEWAYNINWVTDDPGHLFAPESPLFVLGCAPVKASNLEGIISDLKSKGIDVYGEDPPDLWRGKKPSDEEFITPTIIPLKKDAISGTDRNSILIQYKNQPMGEGANPTEYDNLCCGRQVWELNPRRGSGLLAITCSEVMDYQLADQIKQLAMDGNYVVHVQCNPKPFNHSWTRFRSGLFDGTGNAAYISANWSDVGINYEGEGPPWGYSGVYTNTPKPSSIGKYDTTHQNGGIVGTKPEYHLEYVWSLLEDSVSIMKLKRNGPDVAASGSVDHADPHICSAWTWDHDNSEYRDGETSVPTHSGCQNWQGRLPNSPLAQELISSISVGSVSPERAQEVTAPGGVLPMKALESFRGEEHEQLGQLMPVHPHRATRGVDQDEMGLMLDMLFAYMEDKHGVKPLQSAKPAKTPINAVEVSGISGKHLSDQQSRRIGEETENHEDENPEVPVSLSILEHCSENRETKRAGWIYDWVQVRGEVDFLPLIATTSISGPTEVKTLNNIDDTSKPLQDPREVDGVSALVGVDE